MTGPMKAKPTIVNNEDEKVRVVLGRKMNSKNSKRLFIKDTFILLIHDILDVF